MLKKLYLFLVFTLVGSNAFCQQFKNEIGLKSDNDAYLFIQQDRYYTNGLFLNFRHAKNLEKSESKWGKLIYDCSIGQEMYNPYTGYVPNPHDQDRPFAAYLFAQGGFSLFSKKETILTTSLQLGVVGPGALGEEAQELLHHTFGFYEIQGWDYQIANTIAANIQLGYNALLHRSTNNEFDFSLQTGLKIGTIYNQADAGVLFRFGSVNPLFNSSSERSIIGAGKKIVKNEFFAYAKPKLTLNAYDATLQGSLFRNNSSITFEPKLLVFSQQVGVNYSTPKFTFDFSLTFRSREVKSSALPQQYGTIGLYYRFGKLAD